MSPARAAGLAGLLLAASAGAVGMHDSQLQFDFYVPDAFTVLQDQRLPVLYWFREPTPAGPVTLKFQRMYGTLDRFFSVKDEAQYRRMNGLPEDAALTLEHGTWNRFEIPVVRAEGTAEGKQWLFLQAQVPIEPEAIMVSVDGPKGAEREVRTAVQAVVASIHGKPSWRPARELEWEVKLVLGLVLSSVVLVWIVRTKRAQRGGD